MKDYRETHHYTEALIKNAKQGVRISVNNPENSVSLFDLNRKNDFGELYCVAPDILESQVEEFWSEYIHQLTEKAFKQATEEDLQTISKAYHEAVMQFAKLRGESFSEENWDKLSEILEKINGAASNRLDEIESYFDRGIEYEQRNL